MSRNLQSARPAWVRLRAGPVQIISTWPALCGARARSWPVQERRAAQFLPEPVACVFCRLRRSARAAALVFLSVVGLGLCDWRLLSFLRVSRARESNPFTICFPLFELARRTRRRCPSREGRVSAASRSTRFAPRPGCLLPGVPPNLASSPNHKLDAKQIDGAFLRNHPRAHCRARAHCTSFIWLILPVLIRLS